MCHNLGQCVNLGDTYTCNCLSGYYGNNCKQQDDCFPSNGCTNRGACVDGNNEYTCECLPMVTMEITVREQDDCYPRQQLYQWRNLYGSRWELHLQLPTILEWNVLSM